MPGSSPQQPLTHRLASGVSAGAMGAARRGADLVRGYWPHALANYRLRRTTKAPVTVSEKMRYRLAFDRRPILHTFADKVAVRDYVRARVGKSYLTYMYGIYATAEDLVLDGVPREFVCKASHGSGAAVISWNGAPQRPLPKDPSRTGWELFTVHPENIDVQTLRAYARYWLSLDYEYGWGRLPEWGYRGLPRRVIVEELLTTPEGGIPEDLKFWTFGGVVKVIHVISSRFGTAHGDLFTRDWQVIPATLAGFAMSENPPPRPDNLDELIGIAERLGAGMDLVRVDLYNLGGRIVFGEMTGTPGGYPGKISPPSFDYWLGQQWALPGESELTADGEPLARRGRPRTRRLMRTR